MTGPFSAYHLADAATHQARVDELGPQGYRIVALNVSGSSDEPRYAAVWVQRPGPFWHAVHGLSAADYQARFDEFTAQALAPSIVTATGVGAQAVFAAVFEADVEGAWYARHDLRWGPPEDPDTLIHENVKAQSEGFLPRSLAVYGAADDPRFAGVWRANPEAVAWAWWWGDRAFHQRTFDASLTGGLRPLQVAVGSDRLLSVFIDEEIGAWTARHNLTAQDYQAAFDAALAAGQRPVTVQAGGIGDAARYAAVFAADDARLPRRFTVTGADVAGSAELDALLSGVMRSGGIRAATVALARDGALRAARGYTWAEDDWPRTRPGTTFRIASVSKAFTCAAVQALVDDGTLRLDTPVFAYLGLSSPDPHDGRADQITVGQCATGRSGLPRDFEGDATFRDIGAGLGLITPPSLLDVARHIYRTPLRCDPGTFSADDDHGYSNAAFHLLVAVIERAGGKAYVDYLRQRVLNTLGIVDVTVGATWQGARHPDEVAGYTSAGVRPSQLDLTADALAADAYGGGALLEVAPGTGGLVTSAGSIARFIASHAVWDLGGRAAGLTRYGDFEGTSAIARSGTDGWDFAVLFNKRVPSPVKDQLVVAVTAFLAAHGADL